MISRLSNILSFKKSLSENPTNVFYTLLFLYYFAISFTKATFVIFLLNKGLSKFDANIVFSVFTITVIFMEPITAIFGELFGRKKSFIAACSLKVVSGIIFFSGHSFPVFVVAEIISGTAVTLFSGSLLSWIVDELKFKTPDISLTPIFTKKERYKSLALIAGGLSGAYLADIDISLPWIAGAAFFLITIFIAKHLFIENNYFTKTETSVSKWQKVSLGYKFVIKDPALFLLVFAGTLTSFALAVPQMIWLPTLKETHKMSMALVGWAWVGIALAHYIGSYFLKFWISISKGKIHSLIAATIVSAIFLTLVKYSGSIYFYVAFYFIFEFFEPLFAAVKMDLINERLTHSGRITVLSFNSLMQKAGTTLGLIAIGSLSEKYGANLAWYIACASYCLNTFIYLLIKLSAERSQQTYREALNPKY